MHSCGRFLAVLALLLAGHATSGVAQTGPLPPGQLILGPIVRGQSFNPGGPAPPPAILPRGWGTAVASITNGSEANDFLFPNINSASTHSFVESTSSAAAVVLTSAPVQYVRFYDPGNAGQVGNFIAPSNAVRGLTPAQIKDVLALPFQPTMQTLVRVPAGTCLLIGKAGPITNSLTQPPLGFWGNGGATQAYIIGKDNGGGCSSAALSPTFISAGSFFQGQGIGGPALVYGPRAGGGNAGNVAAALDRGPYPMQFSAMDGLYNSLDLLNYGDATQLRVALLQLDGEIHATTQTVLLGDSLYVRQMLLGRMRQASAQATTGPAAALAYGGPMLASADAGTSRSREIQSDYGPGLAGTRPEDSASSPGDAVPETAFWMQGVAAWGQLQGMGDTAGVSRNLGGFFVGADHRFAPNWIVGIAGGFTNSSVGMGDRSSTSAVSSLHLAGYTGAAFNQWDVRAGAAVSFNTVNTSRSIVFPGFFDIESAGYGAITTQLFTEAGYRMVFDKIAVQPFAGFAAVHLNTDGLTESGSPGTAGLSASGASNILGFSTLGLRAATSVALSDSMVLTPQLSVAWQHAYGNTAPTSTLAFNANGASFTTTALPLARDVAIVEAGLVLHINRQLALQASYFGQFASGLQDTWISARFGVRF